MARSASSATRRTGKGNSGEDEFLGALTTQIADTMDPEEFRLATWCIASMADEMEKKMGVDTF